MSVVLADVDVNVPMPSNENQTIYIQYELDGGGAAPIVDPVGSVTVVGGYDFAWTRYMTLDTVSQETKIWIKTSTVFNGLTYPGAWSPMYIQP